LDALVIFKKKKKRRILQYIKQTAIAELLGVLNKTINDKN
jgi:hypothetical protein